MDFNKLSVQQQKEFSDLMFTKLSSPEELKDWIKLYLGLEYPNTITDKLSNSNPLDAIWQIYHAFLVNDGKVPGAIWLSARECLKTLSVAVLEVILMLHFKLEIAHGSATEAQSHVCIRYIEGFLFKIEPLIKIAGWQNVTANKRTYEFQTPEGPRPFIRVVICTPKGMNSLHANLFCVDELDLADKEALDEGKNIVGYSKGIHGFTLFLSTLKYNRGNMIQVLDNRHEMGYELFRWNILDVTERCDESRHLPDDPKEDRYVATSLPLKQLTKEEYDLLPEVQKSDYELIEKAHKGCASCLLLPICRTNLSKLPKTAVGNFYKPIKSVIQKFRENSPEKAESQLLCWKPGAEGLVFPRFSTSLKDGNVITLDDAYETLTGTRISNVSELTLLQKMKDAGIEFFAGVDWGYTHDSVIVIYAEIPNGDIWCVDCFASPGLEFSDILEVAISFRDKYSPQKWYCDTAMPSHLKSFNKNGMRAPNFTKDTLGGIESMRSKMVDSTGKRRFKVLYIDNNKKVINALSKHGFVLDGQGNVTAKPDDDIYKDIADASRYVFQNKWPIKGPQKPTVSWTDSDTGSQRVQSTQNADLMRNEIASRIVDGGGTLTNTSGKKGGIKWTF